MVVEATIHEVASHRGWAVLALNVRTNHVHVIVSADTTPERVMNDFKSYATRRMRERGLLPESVKVWTRHGSTRYLWDDESIFAAGRYVAEGQGADLPSSGVEEASRLLKSARPEEPLPYGHGSVRANPQSRDRKGADRSPQNAQQETDSSGLA